MNMDTGHEEKLENSHCDEGNSNQTDVFVTFSDVDSTKQNDFQRTDIRNNDVTPEGHKSDDTTNLMLTEGDTDTDTIILDSDEDLEIVQTDELINPPPVMLSLLKTSLDKPQLRYKPHVDTKTADLPDSEILKMDNPFKVPKPLPRAKPRFEAFLEVPQQHETMVASAGSDLISFRSNQVAPVPVFQSHGQIEPIRRVRRYNSEPYWSSRQRRPRGTWRTTGLVRKSSPRRDFPQKFHGNKEINHIWFKPGSSHPLLAMDSKHMPKFLRRRIQKQKELENRRDNENNVKHPCFHCGCPGNHMQKFMKKRLLRKLKTTTVELDRNAKGSISMNEMTLLQDVPIGKMRTDTGNLNLESESSSSGEDDLETRINRMRKRLLKRQSRMEVLERVMYRKKPKGVFIASLMSPKHRMLQPKRGYIRK